MTTDQFKASLQDETPPAGVSLAQQAMWYDANGAWVHAYLHRVEGDEFNAGYWYRRANRPHSQATLAEEWEEIVAALCD